MSICDFSATAVICYVYRTPAYLILWYRAARGVRCDSSRIPLSSVLCDSSRIPLSSVLWRGAIHRPDRGEGALTSTSTVECNLKRKGKAENASEVKSRSEHRREVQERMVSARKDRTRSSFSHSIAQWVWLVRDALLSDVSAVPKASAASRASTELP